MEGLGLEGSHVEGSWLGRPFGMRPLEDVVLPTQLSQVSRIHAEPTPIEVNLDHESLSIELQTHGVH